MFSLILPLFSDPVYLVLLEIALQSLLFAPRLSSLQMQLRPNFFFALCTHPRKSSLPLNPLLSYLRISLCPNPLPSSSLISSLSCVILFLSFVQNSSFVPLSLPPVLTHRVTSALSHTYIHRCWMIRLVIRSLKI